MSEECVWGAGAQQLHNVQHDCMHVCSRKWGRDGAQGRSARGRRHDFAHGCTAMQSKACFLGPVVRPIGVPAFCIDGTGQDVNAGPHLWSRRAPAAGERDPDARLVRAVQHVPHLQVARLVDEVHDRGAAGAPAAARVVLARVARRKQRRGLALAPDLGRTAGRGAGGVGTQVAR
eukprot:360687-Chlamydomonas_euryale.AAC.1